ncbi:carboxylesterase [Mycobacteroides abscessus subsp. abscessus]|nr:carboxylesterase [Mycobacteroides abscessus subsp. abscessus]
MARSVSDEMQRRWLAFARTGVPGDGWPAHTVPDRQVLIIDNPSRLEADPDADRRPLWQDVTSIV